MDCLKEFDKLYPRGPVIATPFFASDHPPMWEMYGKYREELIGEKALSVEQVNNALFAGFIGKWPFDITPVDWFRQGGLDYIEFGYLINFARTAHDTVDYILEEYEIPDEWPEFSIAGSAPEPFFTADSGLWTKYQSFITGTWNDARESFHSMLEGTGTDQTSWGFEKVRINALWHVGLHVQEIVAIHLMATLHLQEVVNR